jgi:glycosyltransferase involved in cell wall biosynthesis
MNIAIFTNNYLPNPYGVSMSIESFRGELEKLGHTVYIFAPKTKGFKDKNPNVFRFPSVDINYKISFPLAIPYSHQIDRILEKLEIDVIHSQHPNLLGWVAKKWAKRKNVPLVFTWHTLYDQYAHFAPPFIPQKLAKWWTISNAVKYANRADQVIVPTESVGEIIKTWGVKNQHMVDIPTGVAEENFAFAEGKSIREKYQIADDEILLVLISRFTAEKNAEFLLRAVVLALQKNSKVKFLAGGDGYLLDALKVLTEDAGVSERVIFTGFIGNDVKKNYYAAGDIFVFASKSETQGMIISEALYAGLPVVAVSATGVKDMVINGVDGFLVTEDEEEFSAAILKLAENDNLRKIFSKNAKKIARENYTAKASASKLMVVYENAIKRKK